jgi:thiamine-phosphate pyrophosphorylase
MVAAARPRARIVVNDRATSPAPHADSVHVGRRTFRLPRHAHRRPAAIVGISTHDPEQIDQALASDASYVAVGPIYGTATKDTSTPRGLIRRYASGRASRSWQSGITLDRAAEVVAAGASALAVISDILVGDDPERRVCAFLARLPAQPFKVY